MDFPKKKNNKAPMNDKQFKFAWKMYFSFFLF